MVCKDFLWFCRFSFCCFSSAVKNAFIWCIATCLFLLLVYSVSYKKLNSLPRSTSWRFSPLLSSRKFTVSGFLFKSLIYFELCLFVLEDEGQFHPLCKGVQFPQCHLECDDLSSMDLSQGSKVIIKRIGDKLAKGIRIIKMVIQRKKI